MHVSQRKSGWRFQLRVPTDLEGIFGASPIRLNLGVIPKRQALRIARLLAGHAESVFMGSRTRGHMSEQAREDLIEELQELLLDALDTAESAIAAAEERRVREVKAVALRMMTERVREQQEVRTRIRDLRGGVDRLHETVSRLPKAHRNALSAQIDELTGLIRQHLEGGPRRPNALPELERWLSLRQGHASSKKVQTDGNRIRDFIEFAGDRPVNTYRYSDIQGFANVLARVPANYSKMEHLKHMTRAEAAAYNDRLPPARRMPTLTGTAIDANYVSPLRMFFRAMAAEHDFRSPLADVGIVIPHDARGSIEREPFAVADLNAWFRFAAQESRPDLKWLPLLGTLTGARIGEMIFLQGKDVYEISPGYWVADLATELHNPDGGVAQRPLKNKSSRRVFALHEVLIEAGFIDYCRTREANEWLFPHAFRYGKKLVADPADAASKRLNRQLREIGIHKKLERTFHSARHTAKDIMSIAKVDRRIADRQTGHAPQTVGDTYGSKRMRADEVEVLAALPLPEGLDVSPYFKCERQ